MMHAKSESDVTSLAPSSPSRSPKRPVYYVQSPSRDSHDGDKSSSMQATPVYNSPMESPSHPSYGRHSRASSASRFSGPFRSSSGRKGNNRKRNDKGWPECNVIQEEGSYDDLNDDKGLSRRCQAVVALLAFVLLFTVFSLILWGASRPYKAAVSVKSLTVNNFYFGEGSDFTGVPTKMLTSNCSLKLSVHNPGTFFGIHVSSTPVNLMYSDITVATGQLKKYYQPRKSTHMVSINIIGDKVPLYGAGSSLAVSDNKGEVPVKLEFGIRTRGNVVGKLVRTKHRLYITCAIDIDSTSNKPIKFKEDSCTYS
ncbi:late embryogenesis abundant protein, group [Thalictrum thalictroides]|uniref:Late embryogenesis abundant protein, group n=1 Tax=Thalictrum thalictroides TaxID=46969 RepID=A0A7J6W994_THATH|nr:late embryogenesis abundant protein, group [Thalictrum thalictroides]